MVSKVWLVMNTIVGCLACASTAFGQAQVVALESFENRMAFVDASNGAILSTNDLTDNAPLADPIVGYNGLARFPGTNNFFAVARLDSGSRHLATLDPATKTLTLIGQTLGGIAGLAFNGDGSQLLATSGAGGSSPHNLYSINLTTGAATQLCDLSDALLPNASPSIAFHPGSGLLYRLTYDFNSEEVRLWEIDITVPGCTMTSTLLSSSITDGPSSLTWSPVLDAFVANIQRQGWHVLDRVTGTSTQVITDTTQFRGSAALDAPVVPICERGDDLAGTCSLTCVLGIGAEDGPSSGGNIENLTEFAGGTTAEVCTDTFPVASPPLHTDIWPPAGWSPVVPGIFPGTTFQSMLDANNTLNSNWPLFPSVPGYLSAAAPTGLFEPGVGQPRSTRVLRFNVFSSPGVTVSGPFVLARYGSEDVRVTISDFTDQSQLVSTVLTGDGERVWRQDSVTIPLLPPGSRDIQFELEYLGSGSDNGFFIDNMEVGGSISLLRAPGTQEAERPKVFSQKLFNLGKPDRGQFSSTEVAAEFTRNGSRLRDAYLGLSGDSDKTAPEAAGIFGGSEGDIRVHFTLPQAYDEIWLEVASFGSDAAEVIVDGAIVSTIDASNPARHSIHNLKLGALEAGEHVITLTSRSGVRYLDFVNILDRGEEEPALLAAPAQPKIRARRRAGGRVFARVRRDNGEACTLSLFGGRSKSELGVKLSSLRTSRKRRRIVGSTRGERVRFVTVVEECPQKPAARSTTKRVRRLR